MREPQPHPVWIEDPNPHWAEKAQQMGRWIMAFAHPLVTRVEHIGSTAVPGLAAKPVIDLMPIVEREEVLDSLRPALESLGFEWFGEFGITGRRFCTLDRDGKRLFHVHCFAEGSAEIQRHLTFRDYLCTHPQRVTAYAAEKRRAAKLHPEDSVAYNTEKANWVFREEKLALEWAEKEDRTSA